MRFKLLEFVEGSSIAHFMEHGFRARAYAAGSSSVRQIVLDVVAEPGANLRFTLGQSRCMSLGLVPAYAARRKKSTYTNTYTYAYTYTVA